MAPTKARSLARKSLRKGIKKEHMERMRAAKKVNSVSQLACDVVAPQEPTANSSEQLVTPSSASKTKLACFDEVRRLSTYSNNSLPSTFMDLNCLTPLFEGAVCKSCKKSNLVLREGNGTKGFSVHLKLWCPECDLFVSELYTSQHSSHFYEMNRKAVASSVGVGMGHSTLNKFCEGMGIRGMHERVYQSHLNTIFTISKEVADSFLKQAREVVIKYYKLKKPDSFLKQAREVVIKYYKLKKPDSFLKQAREVVIKYYKLKKPDSFLKQAREVVIEYYKLKKPDAFTTDGILEIPVSYDGTWFKRGHTSKLGCGAIIDLGTGLVIDFHVMSLYCQLCRSTGEKLKARGGDAYDTWPRNHKDSGSCSQNYVGSSGGMEVEGALTLWRRSMAHGMRYTTFLGDGDTKTFLALTKAAPYGETTIRKEECVNHVAKRLGTCLRNMKSTLTKQSVQLGGNAKGSLTDTKINLLQTYYGNAVRAANSSVEERSRAIGAGFYHSISTDDNPQHQYCPPGHDSWCWYQRHIFNGITDTKRKDCSQSTFLNERVASHVKDIYDRLTNPELLSRCLLGKTQNTNESLHSVIWSRCPKHLWFGYKRVFIATVLGIGEFNMGAIAFHQFMASLGCDVNETSRVLGGRRDKRRIKGAANAQLTTEKKRRETRRLASSRFQKEMAETEGGPSYMAGGF